MKTVFSLMFAGTAMFVLSACNSTTKNIEMEKAFDRQSANAQKLFYEGKYLESSEIYLKLANEELNGNTPLYLCEAIPAKLLLGEDEKAFEITKRAIELLEGFYDPEKEKEAASFWGREAVKVYKGDPYERSMLYFLYGIQLLERNQVDNAAAAFKRSLLLDGDTENQKYKSDFGLPFFMLAKCNYLQGDINECRENLKRAFFGACVDVNFRNRIFERLNLNWLKYDNIIFNDLREYAGMAGREGFKTGLNLSATEKNRRILDWLFKNAKSISEIMDFDSVIFIWDGNGPKMTRAGTDGETRMIIPGKPSYKSFFVETENGFELSNAFLEGLGNVNFQGITRGGREMDNILEKRAERKRQLRKVGDTLLYAGTGAVVASSMMRNRNSLVALAGLGVMAGGLTIDAIANSGNAEADTRNWRTLPHSLKFYCLKNEQSRPIVLCSPFKNDIEFVKTFPPKSSDGPVKFYHAGSLTECWDHRETKFAKKHEELVPVSLQSVPVKNIEEKSATMSGANKIPASFAGTWKSKPIQYSIVTENLVDGQWKPATSESRTQIVVYHFYKDGTFKKNIESYSESINKRSQKQSSGTWARDECDLKLKYTQKDFPDQHLRLHFVDEKTAELYEADADETMKLRREFYLQNYQKHNIAVKDFRLKIALEKNGSVTQHTLLKTNEKIQRKKTQIGAIVIERQ